MLKQIVSNKQAMSGLIVILILCVMIIFADYLVPNDPLKVNLSEKFTQTSWQYPLGTDQFGRCLLSRLIYGCRYSLGISFIVIGSVLTISFVIRTISGYYGGLIDRLVVGICNIFMSFPPMVLVLALVGLFGSGGKNLVFAMVFSLWAGYTKIIRGYVLNQKNRKYIEAAKVFGTPSLVIIIKHIIPNIISPILVYTFLSMGQIILMISGFSFLGLGVQLPKPEWGAMLYEAKTFLYTNPELLIYPAVMVIITSVAFNIFGDALRDILDPLDSKNIAKGLK